MKRHKLLFVGADSSTEDALRYAQSLGVYTIVTDYRPKEMVRAKQLADEAWMVDVADLDTMEKRCREEKITAAYAGNHEFCLDQCRLLCKRLNFPFYASDNGWKAARDKAFYKEICEECGLNTPKWCRLKEETLPELSQRFKFPVVIKPVDSCAQQGLSVVYYPDEVPEAYRKALVFSASKEVIAEEFVDGIEIYISVYFHENQVYCLGVFENFQANINGRNNLGMIVHNGRYNEYIRNEILPKFTMVAQRLECWEGPCLFQCIYKDGILYNIELGYRLDGVCAWRIYKKAYGISDLELALDYSLANIHRGKIAAFNSPLEHNVSMSYFLWARPGQVERIIGLEELCRRTDISLQINRYKEGDIIRNHNNMRSIAYHFTLYGKDHLELDREIKEINNILHMLDHEGKDMLIYLEGYYDTWLASMNGDMNKKYYVRKVNEE